MTAISPPIFGLDIHQLGQPGRHAVAVVIPPSVDGPHLIYRGEYFGAPIRNDADTFWMKERQIETMYRARFDERRHTAEATANLYDDAAAGRDTDTRAWLIAVAHPRLHVVGQSRLTRDQARMNFERSRNHALEYASRKGIHPLESVDHGNPRPGLRRWIAPNKATGPSQWKESWVSAHNDGSASLATAIGGHRTHDGHLPGERIESSGIECAIADFMGVIRAVSEHVGTSEYEVRVGIEWSEVEPLIIQTVDGHGFPFDGHSLPIARYTPVAVTVLADADRDSFFQQVHDLAEDCVNQGGITSVRLIKPLSSNEA